MKDEVHFSISLVLTEWWHRHSSGALDLSLSMLARGVGAPLAFFANIVIARILGPTDFGVYMTLLSAGLVAGGIAAYGVGPVLTREIAASPEQQRPTMVRVMSRWALRLTGVASLCAMVVLLLWLSSGLGAPPSSWVERLGIIGIVLTSVWTIIASGVLSGLSQVARSQAISNVLKNGFLLTGGALLLLAGAHDVANVIWLQVASIGLAAVVGGRWALRAITIGFHDWAGRVNSSHALPEQAVPREWGRAAGHFLAMSAGTLVLGRLDVIIVNAIAGPMQAGLFSAAARLGQSVAIAGLVWIAWLQPRMAEQWQQKQQTELKRSLRIGLAGSGGMTIMLVGIGWLLAPELITLLGGGFEDAVWPFRSLLLGYILWGVSVPYYVLLTMSGRERFVSRIVWLQLGLTLAVSLPLISYFGALGGAWGWAGGLSAGSLCIIAVEYFSRARNVNNGV